MSIKKTVKKLEQQFMPACKNSFKVSRELEEAARARIRAAIGQPDRDGTHPEEREYTPEEQNRFKNLMVKLKQRADEDRKQLAERGIYLD